MHAALRRAEEAFAEYFAGYTAGDHDPITAPALSDVVRLDDVYRQRLVFTAQLADGSVLQWFVDWHEADLATQPSRDEFVDLYERMAGRRTTWRCSPDPLYGTSPIMPLIPAMLNVVMERAQADRNRRLTEAIMFGSEAAIIVGIDPASPDGDSAGLAVSPRVRTELPAAAWRNLYGRGSLYSVPGPRQEAAELAQQAAVDLRPGALNLSDIGRVMFPQYFHALSFYGYLDPVAQEKAEQLLQEWLTPEQAQDLRQTNYFHVMGGKTGKRYRIRRGTQMNVFEVDYKGIEGRGLCFAPDGHLPAGDVMLAQKLSLELSEGEALHSANTFVAPRGDPYLWAAHEGLQRPAEYAGQLIAEYRGVPIRQWDALLCHTVEYAGQPSVPAWCISAVIAFSVFCSAFCSIVALAWQLGLI